MSWGMVCDTLHAHRKVAKAGLEAMGLWVVAMSWSKAKKTDGFIPSDRPVQLADDDGDVASRCVDRLVKARLWEPVEGGWRFHDWDAVQRSTEEEETRRAEISAARAEAGRRGGLARAANASNAKQTQATPSNAEQAQARSESKPSPSPDPENTHSARAGEAASGLAAGSSDDPDVGCLLAELRRHPAVVAAARTTEAGETALLRLAEVVAGIRMSTGRPVDWYVAAVSGAVSAVLAEASGDHSAPGWPRFASKVGAFARGARRPREDRDQDRASSELEEYVAKRWVGAREAKGLGANDPDPHLVREAALIADRAAARAKPAAADGWKPSGVEVTAFWIRRFLGERDGRAGGVEDREWPFGFYVARIREYPLPSRADVRRSSAASAAQAPPSEPRPVPLAEEPPAPEVTMTGLKNMLANLNFGAGGIGVADGPGPANATARDPPLDMAAAGGG